jgi:hypothetical protein
LRFLSQPLGKSRWYVGLEPGLASAVDLNLLHTKLYAGWLGERVFASLGVQGALLWAIPDLLPVFTAYGGLGWWVIPQKMQLSSEYLSNGQDRHKIVLTSGLFWRDCLVQAGFQQTAAGSLHNRGFLANLVLPMGKLK